MSLQSKQLGIEPRVTGDATGRRTRIGPSCAVAFAVFPAVRAASTMPASITPWRAAIVRDTLAMSANALLSAAREHRIRLLRAHLQRWRATASAAEFHVGDAGQPLRLQHGHGVFLDRRAAFDREGEPRALRVGRVEPDVAPLADLDAVVLDGRVQVETGDRLIPDRQDCPNRAAPGHRFVRCRTDKAAGNS